MQTPCPILSIHFSIITCFYNYSYRQEEKAPSFMFGLERVNPNLSKLMIWDVAISYRNSQISVSYDWLLINIIIIFHNSLYCLLGWRKISRLYKCIEGQLTLCRYLNLKVQFTALWCVSLSLWTVKKMGLISFFPINIIHKNIRFWVQFWLTASHLYHCVIFSA